ncbi:HPr kinase/phosphorylase [Tranquillimonas rosea]|uniref:HPr kinase/phosphorylase n=1 Tax=Tranquillimonas rosea TaxID=641238 RepID=UPI003BA9732D
MSAGPGTATDRPGSLVLHASCVALGDRAVLIRGASGSGKSTLALALLARGAALVADDRCALEVRGGRLLAEAPPTIPGIVESRGVGLIRVPYLTRAAVTLVVDLDGAPDGRLPPLQNCDILGQSLPLLPGYGVPHLQDTLWLLLNEGTLTNPDAMP